MVHVAGREVLPECRLEDSSKEVDRSGSASSGHRRGRSPATGRRGPRRERPRRLVGRHRKQMSPRTFRRIDDPSTDLVPTEIETRPWSSTMTLGATRRASVRPSDDSGRPRSDRATVRSRAMSSTVPMASSSRAAARSSTPPRSTARRSGSRHRSVAQIRFARDAIRLIETELPESRHDQLGGHAERGKVVPVALSYEAAQLLGAPRHGPEHRGVGQPACLHPAGGRAPRRPRSPPARSGEPVATSRCARVARSLALCAVVLEGSVNGS